MSIRQTGQTALWEPALGDCCSEPIFIERHAAAAESDGWLLSVVYRGAEDCSDFAVFNAGDVARGPIGLAHLAHRVPARLHGNWRADA
ncbi:MAG TPA: carotenoid oxygenase family protein [Burkholderiaceae bacterium]|nr:carotenoid oxygenase family protein [Burkholderiaceae bacterium]